MRLHRRRFLQSASAAAVTPIFGCRGGDAGATPTDTGAPAGPKIEHVVFVMMENRSFDHLFGALSLNEGRADIDGLQPGMSNPGPSGVVTPAPLAEFCVPDPPHGWDASHAQFNGGSNDGFATQYALSGGAAVDPAWVLGYHDRSVLPITYALAESGALCQRWFCSVMGPTWPNRLYSHGAQSQGFTSNDLPLQTGGFFSFKTIWDLMDEAGQSWSYYFSDAPFVAVFGSFALREEIRPLDDFFADCAAGTLPALSQVEPAFSFNDDHPPHHPLLGQLFLGSVYNAIAKSPLWNKTLIVVTYDEHGGFFDHVPPPKTDDDRVAEGFDQLGFRVPAFVLGPWVKPGIVSDTTFDHTSYLREVQRRFDLPTLTRRDAAANDLSSLLDEGAAAPAAPVVLPTISLTEEEILAQCDDGTATTARSLHQPELEALLDSLPRRWRAKLDRRHELDRIAREAIVRAEALGVLRLR